MPLFVATPSLMCLFAVSCTMCTFTVLHNATSTYTCDRITTLHRVWAYTHVIAISCFF